MHAPSEALARARRFIDDAPGVVRIGDWIWLEPERKWRMVVTLRHGLSATPLVPDVTVWHVLADTTFPHGKLRLFPAVTGSIEATFQHQRFNSHTPGRDFRNGEICLDDPLGRAGVGFVAEPADHSRLAWRIDRALRWLLDAARGELAKAGEWFELPDFPGAEVSNITLAFLERPSALADWLSDETRSGVATVLARQDGDVVLAKAFSATRGTELRRVDWGELETGSVRTGAVWVRLGSVPAFEPWCPPATFGELRALAANDNIDLLAAVQRAVQKAPKLLRDGDRHLLLVGFPVPERVAHDDERLHWQGALLPPFLHRRDSGFRAQKKHAPSHDVTKALPSDLPLEWVRSENWADDQLTSRGAFPREVTDRSVLVVGCGALGSTIAEVLVRGGCRDVALLDDDDFRAGNAVRHTLTLEDAGCTKVDGLARRLRLVSPSADVKGFSSDFPGLDGRARLAAQRAQLVIDTTGDDAVLHSLPAFDWSQGALLATTSIGYRARRLFFYAAVVKDFSPALFRAEIRPWLARDRQEMQRDGFPREGIGCWHPVFPARADDIWLAATASVRLIAAECRSREQRVRVLEQGPFGFAEAGDPA